MPAEYKNELFNAGVCYKYKTYKIMEQDEEQLKKSNNIFALVVLASIYTIKAKNDNMKANFKRELVNVLKQKGYNIDKRKKLFYFLGCIIEIQDLELSKILNEELMKELKGEAENMDITWNDVIRKSGFAKFAIEEELREKELKQEKTRKEEVVKIAKRLLKQGYTIKEISDITEIPEKELKKIKY